MPPQEAAGLKFLRHMLGTPMHLAIMAGIMIVLNSGGHDDDVLSEPRVT